MGPRDPWTWLLGRTPEGAWRHVAYSSVAPGQGQDPADEPRVEVVRRLIAYPPVAFRTIVEQAAAFDAPARRVRWLCFRSPGTDPARPYWVCFVSAMPPSRRFHFGVELFDRDRLGLWFLSGFEQESVPRELLRPFPSRADLRLPRLELSDATLDATPAATWLREAWEDRLRFSRGGSPLERPIARIDSADASLVLDAEVLAATRVSAQNDHPEAVSPRAARARLVACPTSATGGTQAVSEGGEGAAHPHDVSLHPIWRLVTTLGRDPRCEVVIVDRSVSSEHARIAWHEGAPALVDLGSKNGTRVDGQPVPPNQPRPLPLEGRIELGAVPCLFVRDAEPADPARHRAKVAALVGKRKITQAQAEAATAEAERRGITPGEALLLSRAIELDDWAPRGGGGCAVLLFAAALTLLLGGCTSFGLPPF